MKSIQQFYRDVETRDNVKNYLIEYLKEEAVKKVFAKEDVSAVAEAKEMIEKAFENMSLLFDKKVEKKEIINQAR